MEQPGLTNMDEDRCRFLRWKGMWVLAEPTPDVQRSNDRAFWCHKTQTCIGPDSQVADEYECSAHRNCYRPL
ncbi:MAG: hypothetical protein KJZ70_16260 [Bryobacterales bacterium]|nr:hypothetical protein [Bryobacterales bacterium]